MEQRITTRWRTRAAVRREDWLPDGLVSGFVATFAMTVVVALAYGVASVVGRQDGNVVQRWFWALVNNPVAQRTADAVALAIGINLLMGLAFALVYARFVEPALGGPGWRKGMLFALIPWILSVVLFLPIMGGGILGAAIGAGPLPVLGNLILHLVYGAVLGWFYAIALDEGLENPAAERAHAAAAERGAAVGVVCGVVVGAVAGWLIGMTLGEGGRGAIVLAGALIGAASGVVAGSFLGMERVRRPS